MESKKSTQHWQVESYDLVLAAFNLPNQTQNPAWHKTQLIATWQPCHHCKILYHHSLLSVSRELHVANVAMTFVLNPILRTIDGDQQSPVQP